MKRWAWHIFCLFSLLVFVSSVTIWVRSYYVGEQVVRTWAQIDTTGQRPLRRNVEYHLMSVRGVVAAFRYHSERHVDHATFPEWYYGPLPLSKSLYALAAPNDPLNLKFAGFQLYYGRLTVHDDWLSTQRVVLPLWLFLPAAVPPFLGWRKWRKRGGRGFPVSVTQKAE